MAQLPKFNLQDIPEHKPPGKLTVGNPHFLHPHEIETINRIRRFGDDVEQITPSQKPNAKTPDIKWRGEHWEIKTISGKSRANIVHALASAKKQSPNIVICVNKTKRSPDAICREISYYFYGSKSIKKIVVIIGQKYCTFP
jgi:hypothetical protein